MYMDDFWISGVYVHGPCFTDVFAYTPMVLYFIFCPFLVYMKGWGFIDIICVYTRNFLVFVFFGVYTKPGVLETKNPYTPEVFWFSGVYVLFCVFYHIHQ